jgi:pyridoxamine 5'-phosphate oxidase family protein
MTFSAAEIDYLTNQRLGRLATIQRSGAPQVSPVGFEYNEALGTVDIGGFAMSTSQKFRNVKADGRVAFVGRRCAVDRSVAGSLPGDSRDR